MSERIESVINAAGMRAQFAASLRNIIRNAVAVGSNDDALTALHEVIAPINISVQCIDSAAALEEVRALLDELSKTVCDESRTRQNIRDLDLHEYKTFVSFMSEQSFDEECGSVTENGDYYARGSFAPGDRVDAAILEHFSLPRDTIGVIYHEDSQGFKDVDTFSSQQGFDRQYAAYEKEVQAYYDSEE